MEDSYINFLASHFGVEKDTIIKCAKKVQKELGVGIEEIYDCVLDTIGVHEALPKEISLHTFKFLPPDEFIKICELSVKHFQQCKTSKYWIFYLQGRSKDDWIEIIKFILGTTYSQKILQDVLQTYIKEYPPLDPRKRVIDVLFEFVDTYSLKKLMTLMKDNLSIHFAQQRYRKHLETWPKNFRVKVTTPSEESIQRWSKFSSDISKLIEILTSIKSLNTEEKGDLERNVIDGYYYLLIYISWTGRYLLNISKRYPDAKELLVGSDLDTYTTVNKMFGNITSSLVSESVNIDIENPYTISMAHYFTSVDSISSLNLRTTEDKVDFLNETYEIINPLLLRDILAKNPVLLQDPELDPQVRKISI